MKSIIIAILILPILAQAIEKRTTIYTSDGYEKELVINVPERFASRADEYMKAYTILYMEWWNRGVGTTARNALKYHFSPSHFNEITPPRKIMADVGRAVESHFSKNDFWEKVALEGANFIENINYKENNTETDTIELNLETEARERAGPRSIKIPNRFSRRAKEYRNEYGAKYIELWNTLLEEKNVGLWLGYEISLHNYRDFSQSYTGVRVGGDIKNEIRKLFSTPEMRKKVSDDMDEYIKNTRFWERFGDQETRENIISERNNYLNRKPRKE